MIASVPVGSRAPEDDWIEVSVSIPGEAVDAVSHRFFELGAPGVVEEPDGARVTLRAHFPETIGREELEAGLTAFLSSLESIFPGSKGRPALARVRVEDWAEGWKQGFPPIEIGRRLRIRSPWEPALRDDRIEIEILPAMAFGTGQHASTHGCLRALDDLAAGGEPRAVLDVGTGSGILAIAAARLGAPAVLAIDDDAVAVAAAIDNVRRNGVDATVSVREGTVASVEGRFALILANLYANLLTALFPAFLRLALPSARLVIAGFLDEDAGAVSRAAAEAGWREISARSIDGWTTLVLECTASS